MDITQQTPTEVTTRRISITGFFRNTSKTTIMEKIDSVSAGKVLRFKSIRFGWLLGIGYWKDIYPDPFDGYAHNILLPLVCIQWGKFNLHSSH